MSKNLVILIGNMGKDPELKYTASGDAIATLSIATSEKYKKDDQWAESTEWHNVVTFRKTAEYVGKYLKKGSKVYVEGKIKTRKWQDKNGQDRYTTEIICKELQSLGGREEHKQQSPQRSSELGINRSQDSFIDDDLPF